jgi:hypothetical protein
MSKNGDCRAGSLCVLGASLLVAAPMTATASVTPSLHVQRVLTVASHRRTALILLAKHRRLRVETR